MAQSTKQVELNSDVFKATQDIAAQAALRAQERLQKVREPPPPPSDVPQIPARNSGVFQKAPDIPPKKASLKQAANNVPPPLPQKPQAKNDLSNGLYAQTSTSFNEMVAPPGRKDYLPEVPSRNPPIPLPTKNGELNGQQMRPTNKAVAANKAPQMDPNEDTSSEDALRGIESGLRNMERAMQEQLTLRSLENDSSNFNVSDFRAGLRNIGSLSSFEGLTPPQYVMDSYRKTPDNVNGNGRPTGLERGISMDQMRLDSQLRSLDSNQAPIRIANDDLKMKQEPGKGRPIEQHMRSLDRNLPLELQYSRNHRQHMQNQQQHQQQQLFLQQQFVSKVMSSTDANRHLDMLNQFINRPGGNNNNPPGQVTNIGRDDLKLRRRSSHDENQILQNTAQGPGTNQSHQ